MLYVLHVASLTITIHSSPLTTCTMAMAATSATTAAAAPVTVIVVLVLPLFFILADFPGPLLSFLCWMKTTTMLLLFPCRCFWKWRTRISGRILLSFFSLPLPPHASTFFFPSSPLTHPPDPGSSFAPFLFPPAHSVRPNCSQERGTVKVQKMPSRTAIFPKL